MRTSQFFISTLKEAPADAEIVSHQLMLRAGLVKRLAGGIYTWMPVGLRVLRKVEAIVREEMDAAGAIRAEGMVLLAKAVLFLPVEFPVAGSKMVAPVAEKFPERIAMVGTEKILLRTLFTSVRLKSPKKNSLFLMMGPPSVPPVSL